MPDEHDSRPWNDYPELSDELKAILNRLSDVSEDLFQMACNLTAVPGPNDPLVAVGIAVDDLLVSAVEKRWGLMITKAKIVSIHPLMVPTAPTMDN